MIPFSFRVVRNNGREINDKLPTGRRINIIIDLDAECKMQGNGGLLVQQPRSPGKEEGPVFEGR